MDNDKKDELLGRVALIADIIAAHSDASERNGNLDPAVYAALREVGLFSMFVPKALGGLEVHPVTALVVWEAVARIDASAGWNLAQASGGIGSSGRLVAGGIDRIYRGGGLPIFAGAGNPPLTAHRTEGGFKVSGSVSFVTGCRHADWFSFIALPMVDGRIEINPATGTPAVKSMFIPRTDAEILDTWDTLGMRATGSADVVVNDKFVPDAMVIDFGGPAVMQPAFTGPLYRLQFWPTILGEAVISIGIAAAAIDLFKTVASSRIPAMSQTVLRDREWVQLNIGRAQAKVDAARAYLHQAMSAAFETVKTGSLDAGMKVSLQLSACHAAEASAGAVDLVHEAAGSSSIRNEQKFQRHFRDVHVCTQHATKSAARYVSAGRMILGLEPDVPLLA
ncbi:MAG: acyl-CoA dehydrogenase family protein [Burkholderiales bacterium]